MYTDEELLAMIEETPSKSYTDEELLALAEEPTSLIDTESDLARKAAIESLTPTFSNRSEVGKAQAALKLKEQALDSGMTPEQYQKLLAGEQPELSVDQLAYRAEVLKQRAKPNVAEDMLLGFGSGALNTLGTIGAVAQGAPGSVVNAFTAPDLEEFKSQYAPGSFDDWTDQEVIDLYNQEAINKGEPTYDEQVSSLPTISENLAAWDRNKQGTVAEYKPTTIPGKVAEFTGGLATLGGTGGAVRTAITGTAGSLADQATEGTPLNLPATILATAGTAGLTGALSGIDDAARAAATRATVANETRKALDAATRRRGIVENLFYLTKSKENKLADIMSMVRVGAGGGLDQSMFSMGQLARSLPTSAATSFATGVPVNALVNSGTIALQAGNLLARSPAVQQTIRSMPQPTVKSITLEGGQITDLPSDIQPLNPGE